MNKELMQFVMKKFRIEFGSFKKQFNKKKHICKNCKKDDRLIHLHHPDYNKPFDVIPLCGSCHRKWHVNNKAIQLTQENAEMLLLLYIHELLEGYDMYFEKWIELEKYIKNYPRLIVKQKSSKKATR